MTRDADFKKLVRARMAASDENYLQAHQALMERSDDARARPGTAVMQTANAGRDDDARRGPTPTEAAMNDGLPVVAVPDEDEARREHVRVIRPFFDGGRLLSIPSRRKARMAVLLELVARFEPGRSYAEPEVNQILRAVHEDHAYLRRELVNAGYLTRAGGVYALPAQVPERDPRWAHEFPAWERVWLPRHLVGPTVTP